MNNAHCVLGLILGVSLTQQSLLLKKPSLPNLVPVYLRPSALCKSYDSQIRIGNEIGLFFPYWYSRSPLLQRYNRLFSYQLEWRDISFSEFSPYEFIKCNGNTESQPHFSLFPWVHFFGTLRNLTPTRF